MTTELAQQILKELPYGCVYLDQEGIIQYFNQKVLKILGIPTNEWAIEKMHISDILLGFPSLSSTIDHFLQSGKASIDLKAIPLDDQFINLKGRVVSKGILITIEDITKEKEKEIDNLQAILDAQERERRRIAKEIHDGVGPIMSTIKLHLDALKADISPKQEHLLQKIGIMDELTNQVADDIRSISHALMPSALIDLGLVEALGNLCHRATESKKIDVHFFHSGIDKSLDIHLSLGLYRIAQELINNALKHAKAETINVQLIKHTDSILLMVEDDGQGFDKKEWRQLLQNGNGLRNIQTRTRAMGGLWTMDTHKGRGMISSIEIPIIDKL